MLLFTEVKLQRLASRLIEALNFSVPLPACEYSFKLSCYFDAVI
jgi:hypothetical protein